MVTPDPDPSPSLRLQQWLVAYLAMVLVGAILGATLVKLPYYTFRPGSVRDTSALIVVDGAETYPARGSISYTTVSLRRSTLLELVSGWLDPDIDVQPQEEVLGDRDRDDHRRLNLAMMDTSQQVATLVALEELGYDVPVSATGETVLEVEAGYPAEGVLAEGDTIVSVDGEPIDDPDDLQRLLEGKRPGDRVALRIKSFASAEESEEEVSLTLAASADDPDKGIMGVQVVPTGVEFDFPIDVSFETGTIGGPSAGLALTLGVIDLLTPGELTGGTSVAVTGTINSDGTVGPIGGAGQKAAAVRRAGVEVFLVPSADYEAAAAHAGDVDVIRVDTLDDALAALAERGGNGLALPSLGDGQPTGDDASA